MSPGGGETTGFISAGPAPPSDVVMSYSVVNWHPIVAACPQALARE